MEIPASSGTTESNPISFNILNLAVGDVITLNIAFNNMAHLELRDLGQGFKDNQNSELARVDLINSQGNAVSPSMGTMRSLLEFLDVQGNLIPVSPRGPQWPIPLPGGSTPSLGNGVDTNLTDTSFTFHGLRLVLTVEELFDPAQLVVFDTIELDLLSEDIQNRTMAYTRIRHHLPLGLGLAGLGFARRRRRVA